MQFSCLLLRALVPCLLIQAVLPQELPFEIPVQLVGFPIIILAVRLSNFLKKLSYAVNPGTYRSRTRRGSEHSAALNVAEIEKKLIKEMGDKVCVYEDVCMEYADKVNNNGNHVLDWQDIFRQYENSPRGKKEFYLLSVFMGDIVKSRELCSQLAKRGRSCISSSPSISSKNGFTHIPKADEAERNKADNNYQTEVLSKSSVETPIIHHQTDSRDKEKEIISTNHQQTTPHHRVSTSEANEFYTDSSHTLSQGHHHHTRPHHLQTSQVHHQVHRHHVEVHYDPAHDNYHGSLFGQNPPHHIHYTSKRVIGS